MTYTPYVIPYLVAGLALLLFLPLSARRRTRGAGAFTLLIAMLAFWSFGNACEVMALTVSGKRLAANIQYFAIQPVSAVWLVFALQYAGLIGRVRLRWIAVLAVAPIITIALAWTDGHQLAKYDLSVEPGSPYMSAKYGPFYYGMVVYQYILLTAGALVLLHGAARRHSLFRAQGILMLLACLVPVLASAAHVLNVGPMPFLDLTPPAFSVGVLIMAFAVYRFGVFDIVPAAREAVIETMPDALLVLDHLGRVIDANPAATRLFGGDGPPLLGSQAARLLAEGDAHLLEEPDVHAPVSVVQLPGHDRLMELRLAPLRHDADVSGWLAVFHDVTERETIVRDLQAALADVNTLSGLIPICAACKRIRNDEGYWQQVESYVSAHAHVEFAQGICPECAAKLRRERATAEGAEIDCPATSDPRRPS